MWLLILQIALVIIAALRGWKWIPVVILLCVMVFGFLMGFGFGTDSTPFLAVIDYGSIAVFLVMAIVGKKKTPSTQTNNPEKCTA